MTSIAKRSLPRILLHGMLLLILLGMVFPLVWMLVISFRSQTPDFSSFLSLFSGPFTLANYIDVLSAGPFARYFLNSVFVSAAAMVGNVLFCTMVAYALARRRIPGKS